MAISTACPFLDFVVVETANGGQACIEFLKKHNLGRISFIVLSKMQAQYEEKMDAPVQVLYCTTMGYPTHTPAHACTRLHTPAHACTRTRLHTHTHTHRFPNKPSASSTS